MSKKDTRTPEERELDEHLAYVERLEARLDETLTRREIVDAIEQVALDYGGNGTHDSDLICDAFRALAKALV